MTSSRIVPAVVLLLAASLFLAGCGIVASAVAAAGHNPEKKIKARYHLEDKSVAVIPFVYKDRAPFDSEHGVLLADTLGKLILANVKKVRLVPAAPAEAYFAGVPPKSADYKKVGQMVGADLVIHGELKNVRLSDNLDCITGKVHVEVYDVLSGTVVLADDLDTRYPEESMLAPNEIDQSNSMRGIIMSSARAVSLLFYDHKVRNRPGG